jgi:hypothetical protein
MGNKAAVDRLDSGTEYQVNYVAFSGRGSKVVAGGGYPRNPQGDTKLQLPEIPWSALEPAIRIERTTCGLRNPQTPSAESPGNLRKPAWAFVIQALVVTPSYRRFPRSTRFIPFDIHSAFATAAPAYPHRSIPSHGPRKGAFAPSLTKL